MIKPNGGGVISLLNYVEQNGEVKHDSNVLHEFVLNNLKILKVFM